VSGLGAPGGDGDVFFGRRGHKPLIYILEEWYGKEKGLASHKSGGYFGTRARLDSHL
jgi:hypothetical protein